MTMGINMQIKAIHLKNFRNHLEKSFSFDPEGSIIIGENGIGKTSLLEAISYFTYGKSILNQNDSQLVNHQGEDFFIKSVFTRDNTDSEFKVYYNRDKIKVIQKDSLPLKRVSDLYKFLQTVYSGPNDVYNIFTMPHRRRHFIDLAISKLYPVYIDHVRKYKNILEQRNSLLKTNFNTREKEAWDKVFVEEASFIVDYRIKFFKLFTQELNDKYKLIVDDKEKIDISLKLSFNDSDFINKMLKVLPEIFPKEKKYQKSLIGPHLDDFSISLNSQNAMLFASQGQRRSIVLGMKLALSQMISNLNGVFPILIFDDTLAELDNDRSNRLLQNLSGKHQIFIASPNADKYKAIALSILTLS